MKSSCAVATCVVIIVLILVSSLPVSLFAFGILAFGAVDSDLLSFNFDVGTPSPVPEFRAPQVIGVSVDISTETLETLENTIVPENDPRELAQRLDRIADIPITLAPPQAPLHIGAQQTFWATRTDTAENFQVDATLRHVTDHVYFWVQDGISYDEADLRDLVETFEAQIYPTNRAFFGSEWTPGVDSDPHLYILYARGLGSSIAGYFSSVDEFHPLAHEYSNTHEMFFLSADNAELDEDFTYGVLAHEFQHMIHWYNDRNEETWMNEGFSELASFLNGYETGGFDQAYTDNPDIQLTDWPDQDELTTPHYGAAFLFLTYFLDRFGEQATQALVAHPNNGMSSIDLILDEIGVADPLRNHVPNADDVFQDWVVASYLQDPAIADRRYTYNNYSGVPNPSASETIRNCPTQTETRTVHQYGVDYIRITCRGDYTLHFEGSPLIPVLPFDFHSGDYAFWSNRGDESDMTLTRTFDFTDHTGPLTLRYWTWYDLEVNYDYLYLEASSDGESWQILTTPSGTPEDPSGNSYGWGYNGQSGNDGTWIQETVDLSRFAGQQILLRFEYVTDAAVNGEGLLLDDIAIPEIGYFTDFEDGDSSWEAAGFARIQNTLPQSFRLSLITIGDATTVEYIPLSELNTADISIAIGGDVDEAILVASGTTRFTTQSAGYRFTIVP